MQQQTVSRTNSKHGIEMFFGNIVCGVLRGLAV
jgi:hypothetical protein